MMQGYHSDLASVFSQLGPNLKRLFVDAHREGSICSTTQVAKALAANPKLGRELRSCYLHILPDDSSQMYNLICTHSTKLTHLEMTFLFGMALDETLRPLTNLLNLHKLNYNPDLKILLRHLNFG